MHTLARLTLLLLLSALFGWGCAGPCEDLAEAGCAHAGEESASCAHLRERAQRVSRDDKRACSVALALVENLEKVR